MYTHKRCFWLQLVCLPCMSVCVCIYWWQLAWTPRSWRHCDDLSKHSTLWCHWLKYHMERHMAAGTELTCLPACLLTYLPARGKAVSQSHFQQINLIWKFSSPCNLKQQQRGICLLTFPSTDFFSPFSLLLSSLRSNYWMREERKGRDRGMDECEKRREEREGGKEGWRGRKAGNYFQRSFC